jgi:hypothetical protein
MRRVVPSQVVAMIDKFFFTAYGDPSRSIPLTGANLPRLKVIVESASSLAEETLPVDTSDLFDCIEDLKDCCRRAEVAQLKFQGAPYIRVREGHSFSVLTTLRNILVGCADEGPAPTTQDLPFVRDLRFREGLRTDISTVNQALGNCEWKAATVLAGSVVEALLLSALDSKSSADIQATVRSLRSTAAFKPGKPHETEPKDRSWSLYHYIEACHHMHLIETKAYEQAKIIIDFRDLIHPAKEKRGEGKCDRGTALSAVAAIEHVVRDLTAKVSLADNGPR